MLRHIHRYRTRFRDMSSLNSIPIPPRSHMTAGHYEGKLWIPAVEILFDRGLLPVNQLPKLYGRQMVSFASGRAARTYALAIIDVTQSARMPYGPAKHCRLRSTVGKNHNPQVVIDSVHPPPASWP